MLELKSSVRLPIAPTAQCIVLDVMTMTASSEGAWQANNIYRWPRPLLLLILRRTNLGSNVSVWILVQCTMYRDAAVPAAFQVVLDAPWLLLVGSPLSTNVLH